MIFEVPEDDETASKRKEEEYKKMAKEKKGHRKEEIGDTSKTEIENRKRRKEKDWEEATPQWWHTITV